MALSMGRKAVSLGEPCPPHFQPSLQPSSHQQRSQQWNLRNLELLNLQPSLSLGALEQWVRLPSLLATDFFVVFFGSCLLLGLDHFCGSDHHNCSVQSLPLLHRGQMLRPLPPVVMVHECGYGAIGQD